MIVRLTLLYGVVDRYYVGLDCSLWLSKRVDLIMCFLKQSRVEWIDFNNKAENFDEKHKQWCLDSQLNRLYVDTSVEYSSEKELSQTYIIYCSPKPTAVDSVCITSHRKDISWLTGKYMNYFRCLALNHFILIEFNSFQLFLMSLMNAITFA